MNQWNFVIAAYALTALATMLLLGWSWLAMRRAEGAVDAAKRQR
jgi:hypothetical protein